MRTTVKTPNTPIVITASSIDYPSNDDERELLWLFERAEQEIASPSSWEPLVSTALDGSRKERGGKRDFHERRADALHKANVIVGWLEKMPRSIAEVLIAAYRPQCWSPRYELTFGRLSGIVPTLGMGSVGGGDRSAAPVGASGRSCGWARSMVRVNPSPRSTSATDRRAMSIEWERAIPPSRGWDRPIEEMPSLQRGIPIPRSTARAPSLHGSLRSMARSHYCMVSATQPPGTPFVTCTTGCTPVVGLDTPKGLLSALSLATVALRASLLGPRSPWSSPPTPPRPLAPWGVGGAKGGTRRTAGARPSSPDRAGTAGPEDP
jgi:hypothetical protein